MNTRKGTLTAADVIGTAILFFIFAVFYKAAIHDALVNAWSSSGLLTKAVIGVVPAAMVTSILTMIWVLQSPEFKEKERRKRRGRMERRPRR